MGGDLKRIAVNLSEQHRKLLDDLAIRLATNRNEVIRRALEALQLTYSSDDLITLQFAGSPEIVRQKWLVIEALRHHKGPAMAAREAGVTRRTIETWSEADPLFAEFAQVAWDESVEQVDHTMWRQAQEGNIKAGFGILNAYSPEYGLIKVQLFQQHVREVTKELKSLAAACLPPDVLDQFEAVLEESTSRLAPKSLGSGKDIAAGK